MFQNLAMKINKQLSGIAGEYYVAAEITRRGYLAAITLRNSDGVDIIASDIEGDTLFSIQVKTTQNKRKWILSQKVENETSEKKFFVFVNIPADIAIQPEYFIVNSKVLASNIYEGHRRWLCQNGKNGKVRNDSSVRQFEPRWFKDEEILSWDQLFELL